MAMSQSTRCQGEKSPHLRLKGHNLHPISKQETSLHLSWRNQMLVLLLRQNHLLPVKKIMAMLKTKGKNLDKNLDQDSWWLPSLQIKRLIATLKWRSLWKFPIPEILLLHKNGLNQRFQELPKLHKQRKLDIKRDKMMKL